jgi:hypothetical protein
MSRKFNQLFHESSSWKKQTVFENVQVSPDLASELLRLNGRNRPISDAFVKRYEADMRSGKWKFAGGTIGISKEGLIVDGQKRLLAVINSGTTQTFNVQTGLDPDSFDVIDIGQPRSAGDTVAVAGYKNHHVLAGACKVIIGYTRGTLHKQNQGVNSGSRISNAEVLEFIEKTADMDLLEEAATYGNKCAYRAKFYSPSTYAAFYYLFSQKDRDAAQLFFDMLVSGENISKSSYSYVYLLRQRLINAQSSNMQLQTIDKYALLIKAWNHARAGKEITYLKWQPNEDFPKIQ